MKYNSAILKCDKIMKNRYSFFDKFLFRIPAFSITDIFTGVDSMNNKDVFFRNALLLSSPDLYEQITKLGMDSNDKKVNDSLTKYYYRAHSRPTPFGILAGCGIGQFGDIANCVIDETKYEPKIRIDTNCLCALVNYLESRDDIRWRLKYYPNDTLYYVAGELRYVEYSYNNSVRLYQISKIYNTEYIQTVLTYAQHGILIDELVCRLVDDEITREDAIDYIMELINSQILQSELKISITGPDQLCELIKKLNGIQEEKLLPIISQIKELVDTPFVPSVQSISTMFERVWDNVCKIEYGYNSKKFLFQADMHVPVKNFTLPKTLVYDVNSIISLLNRIRVPAFHENLDLFAKSFYDRYENMELPLCEVLDSEIGIGYPVGLESTCDTNPLIDDLIVPQLKSASNMISLSNIEKILLNKLVKVINTGAKVISISEDDFPKHNTDWNELHDTISVLCSITNDDTCNPKLWIKSIGGASGASLTARFSHLSDDILTHNLQITEKEQEMSSELLVEIVHLPQDRVGNIAIRPVLRDYEINYLSAPCIKTTGITTSDILVSVKNRKIVLRSKKLNRVVVPRLTNAHNHNQGGMPVYRFLCDLQYDKKCAALGLIWTPFFYDFDYLPRLEYKGHILSPQIWKLNGYELKSYEGVDDEQLILKISELRNSIGLPKYVTIQDGDNPLLIDLNNVRSIRAMISEIRDKQFIHVSEFMFTEDSLLIHGQKGGFVNEFVFSLYKNQVGKDE